MMKVWIGYSDMDYDGCSEPEVVFDNEEKAKAWVKKDTRYIRYRQYKELEMNKDEE